MPSDHLRSVSDEDNRAAPSIVTVDRDIAVMKVKIESSTKTIDNIERKLDSALQMFATKEELKSAKEASEEKFKTFSERVSKIEAQIGWGVKTVLGLVIAAVVSAVLIVGRH